jgi:hypothetical protein
MGGSDRGRVELRNEELRHIDPVIRATKSKKIPLVGLVARMRETRNTYSVLARKYERNIPLRR